MTYLFFMLPPAYFECYRIVRVQIVKKYQEKLGFYELQLIDFYLICKSSFLLMKKPTIMPGIITSETINPIKSILFIHLLLML